MDARTQLPAWALMWLLAVAVYLVLKFLTYAAAPSRSTASPLRRWGYVCCWPGLNATQFLATLPRVPHPHGSEWLAALGKTLLGLLILGVAALAVERHRLLAGWLGMIGLLFCLHFGAFHLLSVAWRAAGVDAPPLMHWPLLARSLEDFWSRRWNRAFRDFGYVLIFRRTVALGSPALATLAVFAASGLIHDLVISAPTGRGWGGPTLYFVLQALELLVARSNWGRRWQLRRGWRAWALGAATLTVPLGLLFPRAFVEECVVPLLRGIARIL